MHHNDKSKEMRNLKIRSTVVHNTWLSNTKNEIQRNEALPISSHLVHLVEWIKQRNGAKIISFDYLNDEYVLCAVLSSGAVLIVDYESETVERFDITPSEICSARWAPDFHVLLLASSEMLYFVTRQFDILNVQPLKSSKSGRGIAARKQFGKAGMEQQSTTVDEYDQRRILLAWNGDANYVAVSYVDNETNSRRFCVFDHESELISHLEQVSNVEETLAYRPTGNLIAASRCDDDKREIIFTNVTDKGDRNLFLDHIKEQ
ncbi:Elongator complex protein 1 [Dirofilaria immitis]|nr:Elongator complex protein 1 [Dirofilaria immitis]